MKELNKITLKLFNTVLSINTDNPHVILFDLGICISPSATYATDCIKQHVNSLFLSGIQLNKSFHKSWKVIIESTEEALLQDQLRHYASTYGTNFQGEVFIPLEELNVPEKNISLFFINGTKKEDLIEKLLDLLRSGIALTEDTLKDIFAALSLLDYEFNGNESIKNKEANIIIADNFNIFPKDPVEFLRYFIYKSTDSTLLINNDITASAVTASRINISKEFKSYGLKKLSTIFNRFKPLFLAFKKASVNNVSVINTISKISKHTHKGIPQNALNLVTQRLLTDKDTHWLSNATVYALFKALSACHNRNKTRTTFTYQIRNGRSWTKKANNANIDIVKSNYDFILSYLKTKINGNGKTVLVPDNISYALPTSEKMFVGNVPTGTQFLCNDLSVGFYWENSWGACDLDLSLLNISGKIGWNANLKSDEDDIYFSGDMTYAENGAVEFFRFNSNTSVPPSLIMGNVFNGEQNSGYKIVVAEGSDTDRKFMIDPNNVMADIKTKLPQREVILGLVTEHNSLNKKTFTLLNFGAGSSHVCGNSIVSDMATNSLYEQWSNPLMLNSLLTQLGFNIVTESDNENKVDFNLLLRNLDKSSFINIFK